MKHLFRDKELKPVIQGSVIAVLILTLLSDLSKSSYLLLSFAATATIWHIISLYIHALALAKVSDRVKRSPAASDL